MNKLKRSLFLSLLLVFNLVLPVTAIDNLLTNPSLETGGSTPDAWVQGGWGQNTLSYQYPVAGHDGERAMSVSITAHTDGDGKWMSNDVPVTPNTHYTFSDYYKADVTSSVEGRYTLTDGTYLYTYYETFPAAAEWALATTTFVTPENAISLSVYHLIEATGTLTTDNYSLTLASPANSPVPSLSPAPSIGPSPSPVPSITPSPSLIPSHVPSPSVAPSHSPVANRIANPSVESSTNNLPTGWRSESWGNNTTTFAYLDGTAHSGNKSLKVQTNSYTNGDAKWFFDRIPVTPGESYMYKDWYQSDVTTEVVVHFTMVDGSSSYLGLKKAPPSNSWAQYMAIFEIPAGAVQMTIFHIIASNGFLITDDFTLESFTTSGFPEAVVSLTFDDSWEENVNTAVPIMASHGYKSTYYFATKQLEESPQSGGIGVSGPLSVTHISNAGHEIGSHSVTHPDMTTLNTTELSNELSESKSYLEGIVGVGKVIQFSSPFGSYNDTVVEVVTHEYGSHRTADEGFNIPEDLDPYRLKVQNMRSNTTMAEFQAWVDEAKAEKSWLILVYHRVTNDNLEEYDTKIQDFEAQMAYLDTTNVAVKTVGSMLGNTGSTPSPSPSVAPSPSPVPSASPSPIPGVNLILNPSFSDSATSLPTHWLQGGWGTNDRSLSYPVAGPSDAQAVQVSISAYTDGDAKWYFEDVPVSSGSSYTYRDQYQSDSTSHLVIRYNSNGTFTYVNGTTMGSTGSSWQNSELNFTVPNGVNSVTIFHLINSIGTLSIDNTSLVTQVPQSSPSPSPGPSGNLVLNPSLTESVGNSPANWLQGGWGNNNQSFAYPVLGDGDEVGAKVEITAYTHGDAKWYFQDVAVTAGSTYLFEDRYLASTGSRLVIRYNTDGLYSYSSIDNPVQPSATDWATASAQFTVPQNVDSVTVFHLIDTVGWLVVDNASLTLRELNSFTAGIVTLSFDDGWSSIYDNALPVLNAAGYASTQFITTGFFGSPGYVTAEQVQAMAVQGHEVGAHTRTHPDLTTLTAEQLTSEVAGSKQDLISFGLNPVTFAYPFGEYNPQVVQAVKDAGFASARTAREDLDGGDNETTADRYRLKTMSVEMSIPVSAIKARIDMALANKVWLILVFHQVDDSGTQYSTPTAKLQEIVDYLQSKSAQVVTISEGVALLD